jgi:hypothetical protein
MMKNSFFANLAIILPKSKGGSAQAFVQDVKILFSPKTSEGKISVDLIKVFPWATKKSFEYPIMIQGEFYPTRSKSLKPKHTLLTLKCSFPEFPYPRRLNVWYKLNELAGIFQIQHSLF